jgi:hypothetical protein
MPQRANNGEAKPNTIFEAWKAAGKEERIDFIITICSLYKRMLCMSMQHLGRCMKDKGKS